jgi:2-phospho-L-lactate guanylyltransferase
MLLDVIRALQKVRRINKITVVSADFSVRRITRRVGVHFLWEGKRRGLNKGVRLALRDALQRNASAALILPADIPLITPHEISRFLNLSDDYPISLTPSKDGAGTNALLLRPPGMIPPAFGKNSFGRHRSIARRKGIRPRVVKLRGLALDVDEPSDLTLLKRRSLTNETGRFLKSIEAERFGKNRAKHTNYEPPLTGGFESAKKVYEHIKVS